MLREIARNAEPCSASPLQAYITDRIAGRPGPAWLDGQPLERAIRVTEILGTALEFGPYVTFEDLSFSERHVADTCGWTYTSKGETGIRRAFRILEASHSPKQSPARGDKWVAFGLLLDEFQNPAQSSSLRRIFEEHIASTAES